MVTTVDDAGTRYGLTANSFASVSLQPPLVLFCVDLRAPSLEARPAEGRIHGTQYPGSSVEVRSSAEKN